MTSNATGPKGAAERIPSAIFFNISSDVIISRVIKEKKLNKFDLSAFLWEQRESNPRPSACKADALNQLSYAPFRIGTAKIDVIFYSANIISLFGINLFSIFEQKSMVCTERN